MLRLWFSFRARNFSSVTIQSFFSKKCVGKSFSSFNGQIDENNIVRSPFPDVNVPSINIYSFVTRMFNEFERNTAFIDGIQGREINYGRFRDEINILSSAFRRMGLAKGDVLALCAPNSLDYPKVFLASVAAGGIVSTCNPTYTHQELNYQFENSGAKYIATIPALLPVVQKAIENLPIDKIIVIDDHNDSTPNKGNSKVTSISTLLKDTGSMFKVESVNSKEDIAVLPYSSGTTGLPKGVMLTHYNIIANCCQLNNLELASLRVDETCMSILPFFHIYGMVAIMLLSLHCGARQVVLPKFEPHSFLSAIQNYRISSANLVPPLILFLAKHPEVSNYDVSSLKSIISGAAPLGGEIVTEAQSRTGVSVIRQAYGLTELSPASHCMPVSIGMKKPSSIGPLIPNALCKIIDVSTGKILGSEQEGELVISGPNVMKGYLNMPEETANCIDSEGWFKTGDFGCYDNDGHFYITDRLKELIKVKGLQVAPAELEAVLQTHPKVADAAVIGIPNERQGEAPKAFVVRRDNSLGKEDVEKYIKERLSEHKWLVGGVEFIEQVPKSASGKILRRHLK